MEKEFVPYELSLEMKGLGFDEKGFGYYLAKTLLITNDDVYNSTAITVIKAPTFSQVFRWFREKHPYRFYILPCSQHKKYLFEITLPSSIFYSTSENEAYNTYEEAELACLKKLIEIVELKSE
jgi:hypothetical protein